MGHSSVDRHTNTSLYNIDFTIDVLFFCYKTILLLAMQRQVLFEMEMCETKRSLILWEVRKKSLKGVTCVIIYLSMHIKFVIQKTINGP